MFFLHQPFGFVKLDFLFVCDKKNFEYMFVSWTSFAAGTVIAAIADPAVGVVWAGLRRDVCSTAILTACLLAASVCGVAE